MVKSLKPSTIKRYSVEQIYRHLDRFCSAFDSDQWQIDFQYNGVRRWDADQGVYLRWSSTNEYSRPAAIEALHRTYYARFIDDDDFQFDDTFYYGER